MEDGVSADTSRLESERGLTAGLDSYIFREFGEMSMDRGSRLVWKTRTHSVGHSSILYFSAWK